MKKIEQIVQAVQKRIYEDQQTENLVSIKKRISRIPFSLKNRLKAPGIHIIAEIKSASPSQGVIHPGIHPVEIAGQYLDCGASALSVLTERDFFGGSRKHLRDVRGAFPRAVLLMKDFVLDEYQIYQARADGADAILLIAGLLSDQKALKLIQCANSLGLDVLFEVHHETEMAQAVRLGVSLVGVNNRDLTDFSIDLNVSERLLHLANPEMTLVSESGLNSPESVKKLSRLGYSGFLIGTQFMKNPQPGLSLSIFKRDL